MVNTLKNEELDALVSKSRFALSVDALSDRVKKKDGTYVFCILQNTPHLCWKAGS
jgi:hypothetical protein